ncbi:hypothetical protein DUNSADRAFT_17937 [Dunaliella salina]|uniref:Encoded protein n=1 Tax=Dunaliella salina TaxID=3046 RepID=A0ABQ7H926_DUNSA|nr:hypothetical protein DUNSADRAFT_17937 [Dunaliella salina]|eukprot:KAF5843359.1 hypothetical protein DUNSADRAFT_17937 [Dunaliella salina]
MNLLSQEELVRLTRRRKLLLLCLGLRQPDSLQLWKVRSEQVQQVQAPKNPNSRIFMKENTCPFEQRGSLVGVCTWLCIQAWVTVHLVADTDETKIQFQK